MITFYGGDRLMAEKKSCRLVLVFVGILISPFPTCFYPVEAQPSSEVASLINQLRSESAEVRRDATLGLGKMGSAAKAAVPQLIELLKKDTYTGVAGPPLTPWAGSARRRRPPSLNSSSC